MSKITHGKGTEGAVIKELCIHLNVFVPPKKAVLAHCEGLCYFQQLLNTTPTSHGQKQSSGLVIQ